MCVRDLNPGRFAALGCRPGLLSCLVVLCLAAPLPAAGATFPRGEGWYFSLFKLFLVVAAYLGWVRLCWWVDKDAQKLKLNTDLWDSLMLACGIGGLLLVWLLPYFLITYLTLLVLIAAPTLAYVVKRNEEVDEADKVLTPAHLRQLAWQYLRIRLSAAGGGGPRNLPIRFIAKSGHGGDGDSTKVTKAEGTRGYQAALEMVYEAVQQRATDIHMEPTKEEMTVRFRVDGILHAHPPIARSMGDGVINIFKVLADLDITERRKPQDGSFSAEILPEKKPATKENKGKKRGGAPRLVDFRVATAGSVVGEKLVMRILDRSRQVTSLKQIGMRERMREHIRELATSPHGMIIVCGPTGSGKSTTLYACLMEIDRFQKNVITLEDPVEYQIENVTQIQINTKAGKTFASELRSILRQDPDVILIGEIRDDETAEIACQAAQTGHMVFTTLHANDTVTAIGRLLDLIGKDKAFMIANAVSAVLSQRLVRVLCPDCKERYKPNPEMLRKANLPVEKIKYFYRPQEAEEGSEQACPTCGGTGYRGRTGVYELLVIGDRIRDLINTDNPNLNAIRQEAVKNGMQYLQEDGLRQVISGETSIQELLRVCK